MKKIIFAAALLFCAFVARHADAQVSVSLSLNIGSQPDWGPTGYDHVDYYYLPDIDCYYYVPSKQFVYKSGSQWVWKSSLPSQYSNYDLYKSYKVVVNKPKPYMHDNDYRTRYSSYKNRHDQPLIRDSHDDKYKRPAGNNRPEQRKPETHQRTDNHRPATGEDRKPAQKGRSVQRHDDKDKKNDREHH